MRLYSWKKLGHEDEVTPAARDVSNELRTDRAFSTGFVACSGSGKTSGIFSLAHEHFVIYMEGSGYGTNALKEHDETHLPLYVDERFSKRINQAIVETAVVVNNEYSKKIKKFMIIKRLFQLEFLTRIFHGTTRIHDDGRAEVRFLDVLLDVILVVLAIHAPVEVLNVIPRGVLTVLGEDDAEPFVRTDVAATLRPLFLGPCQ